MKVLSFIVAVIALFFSYKSFVANKPSQISVYNRLNLLHGYHDLSATTRRFIYLMVPDSCYLSISDGTPVIANNTSRSIKNFSLVIRAYYDNHFLQNSVINRDFEIIHEDSDSLLTVLRYKYDVLKAHSEVPLPIKRLRLKEPHIDNRQSVHFLYSVTYDNIDSNRDFEVDYFSVLGDSECPSDSLIDELLNHCYDLGFFPKYKDDYLITIVNGEDIDIINKEELFKNGRIKNSEVMDIQEDIFERTKR